MIPIPPEYERLVLEDVGRLQSRLREAAGGGSGDAEVVRDLLDARIAELHSIGRSIENGRHRMEAGVVAREVIADLAPRPPESKAPRVSVLRRVVDFLAMRTPARPEHHAARTVHPLTDERSRELALRRLRVALDLSLPESAGTVGLELKRHRLADAADGCDELARMLRRGDVPAELIACASDVSGALYRDLEAVRVCCLDCIPSSPGSSIDNDVRLASMLVKSIQYVDGVTYVVSDAELRSIADRTAALAVRLREGATRMDRRAWAIRVEMVASDGIDGLPVHELTAAMTRLGAPSGGKKEEPA